VFEGFGKAVSPSRTSLLRKVLISEGAQNSESPHGRLNR
jgi:hypothetical protein